MLLFCGISLFSIGSAFSANYYVKNNGNDKANGLSDSNAWKTLGKINSVDFSNGDIINFMSDDIFDDATLTFKNITGSGKKITVQTYGTGKKAFFDGDSIRPFVISNTSINHIIIKNVDISGQDFTASHNYLNEIRNIDNITLDGIEGNGSGGTRLGNTSGQAGKNPFFLEGGSGVIEIANCILYNWGPDNMPIDGISDCYAFEIDRKKEGSFLVHDNIVHDVNADAIQIRVFEGSFGKIYKNTFYNCGENAVDIKGSSNIQVYENNFYRETNFIGHGGIGGIGTPLINIIPTTAAGGGESNNNVIENNYLHHNPGEAIYIGYIVDTYYCRSIIINDNIFKETGQITIGSATVGVKIYNNYFEKTYNACVYENNSNPGTEIYNNTIKGGINTKYGVYMGTTNGSLIDNNHVTLDNPSNSSFGLYVKNPIGKPIIRNNTWYNSSSSNRVYYKGTAFSSSNIALWVINTDSSENFVVSGNAPGKVLAPKNFSVIQNS
jgi:hypothetical protein